MTREDALLLEYREAERAANESEYAHLLAAFCAACGAAIQGSPYHEDFGALCEPCAGKERQNEVNTKEALLEAARLTRGRAEYFECRAGRRDSRFTPPATQPLERARHERRAFAFLQAAAIIEQLAEERKWP